MEYGHSWYVLDNVTSSNWYDFKTNCKKLYDNLPNEVLGEKMKILTHKDFQPMFSDIVVFFGGENIFNDIFHVIRYSNLRRKCRTYHRPYDLLVVSCLIAGYETNVLRFNSDGFSDGYTYLRLPIDYYNKIIKPKAEVTLTSLLLQSDEFNKIYSRQEARQDSKQIV